MTTLADLRPGQTGTIATLQAQGPLLDALTEAGFSKGADIEVLGRGLIGGTPLSVRIGRAVVALRREEASAVVLS